MMKILFVSERCESEKKSDYLANEFALIGSEIIYTKNNIEKLNFLDRILHKLCIELDKSFINNKIIEKCLSTKYDAVIIYKGNRIYPSTLKKIKKINPYTCIISYSGDNMAKWHNKSFLYHYGSNYYDLLFIVNIPSYKKIENFCRKKIIYFDKRADRFLHKPITSSGNKYYRDVLFIGSYEIDRYKLLDFLAVKGVKVDVYGNGWGRLRYRPHSNLNIHYEQLVGQDYVNAISTSKINLGFLRKANKDTQTSRSFEIPAIGGFMLMERSSEHQRLFVEGKEAEFFQSRDELLDKVQYYLINSAEREAISRNGHLRVVSGKYYFNHLAKEILLHIIDSRGQNQKH